MIRVVPHDEDVLFAELHNLVEIGMEQAKELIKTVDRLVIAEGRMTKVTGLSPPSKESLLNQLLSVA